MTIKDLQEKSFNYCMHGLGAYKGVRQTNTREAFLYWHKKGIRIFEVDIGKTDDEKFVAVAHTVDAKSLKRMEVLEKPQSYTEEWFVQQRLFPLSTEGLTPISLITLLHIMEDYPDSVFMFDLFGMFSREAIRLFLFSFCEIVKDNDSLKERILLEAYNHDMIEEIKNTGFEVIYCARHEYSPKERDISKEIHFLKANGVSFISYPWFYTKEYPKELSNYIASGFTVFSRTKYNTNNRTLKNAGVKVNIIANRFTGVFAPLQVALYFAYCFKRLIIKKTALRN